MPLPVRAGNPLIAQQRVIAMRWTREGPFNAQVVPKANDENPFAFLGNAIIGRVDQRGDHVVRQSATLALARGFFTLQASEMFRPVLALQWRHLGELQLELDV